MTEDRERRDRATRTRVDEIATQMELYRERLDQRYRRVIAFVVVVALIALGGVTWAWRVSKSQGEESARNSVALCAVRGNLEKGMTSTMARLRREEARLRRSEEFLRDNPAGIPGIPARLLRESTGDLREGVAETREEVANQQRSIAALSGVECAGVELPTPDPTR